MTFCFYELNLVKILCLMLLLRLHLKETHNVSFRINTDNQRANWSRLTGHTHTASDSLHHKAGWLHLTQQCCCCCRADWTGGVGKQHNTEAVGGITCTLVMRLIRTYILGLSANKIIFINCQKTWWDLKMMRQKPLGLKNVNTQSARNCNSSSGHLRPASKVDPQSLKL